MNDCVLGCVSGVLVETPYHLHDFVSFLAQLNRAQNFLDAFSRLFAHRKLFQGANFLENLKQLSCVLWSAYTVEHVAELEREPNQYSLIVIK